MIGTPKELIRWLLEQDPEKRFEVEEHHEKRSLQANAYAWVLIQKIADGYEEAAHLATLCGSCHQCEQYCPMNIKISDLILRNRIEIAKENGSLLGEKRVFNFIMKRVSSRKEMDKTKEFLNRLEMKQMLKKTWGVHREIPTLVEKSFSEMWREINGIE